MERKEDVRSSMRQVLCLVAAMLPLVAPAKTEAELQKDFGLVKKQAAPQKAEDAEINAAIAAAKRIKAAMKNPASFKLEGFLIFPGGATCYDYRGANSFNAVIPGRAVFIPPSKLLTQEANGNAFVKAWNDTCTKAGGKERARGINALGAV